MICSAGSPHVCSGTLKKCASSVGSGRNTKSTAERVPILFLPGPLGRITGVPLRCKVSSFLLIHSALVQEPVTMVPPLVGAKWHQVTSSDLPSLRFVGNCRLKSILRTPQNAGRLVDRVDQVLAEQGGCRSSQPLTIHQGKCR